jgi:thioredoxin 1
MPVQTEERSIGMNMRRIPATVLALCVVALTLLGACSKERSESKSGNQMAAKTEAGRSRDTAWTPPAQIEKVEIAQKSAAEQESAAKPDKKLPRLVDLGRGTCIPCKQMAPILKELTDEYNGRAIVEVIDLRERPEAAKEYGIKLIPTQIFFDRNGSEVSRHEGFLAKDAIIAKFREMGVK